MCVSLSKIWETRILRLMNLGTSIVAGIGTHSREFGSSKLERRRKEMGNER